MQRSWRPACCRSRSSTNRSSSNCSATNRVLFPPNEYSRRAHTRTLSKTMLLRLHTAMLAWRQQQHTLHQKLHRLWAMRKHSS